MRRVTLLHLLLLFFCSTGYHALVAQAQPKKEMKRILIHVTHGPEDPTRAALAFLVARTAIEEGHTVTMFLAGDAVQLLRNEVLDNTSGVGTGKLRDHFDAISKGGGKFYLSGMSSKARGVTDSELIGKSAEFAMPKVLLQLAIEADKMFVY
jgi:predicted peroxiredoxin